MGVPGAGGPAAPASRSAELAADVRSLEPNHAVPLESYFRLAYQRQLEVRRRRVARRAPRPYPRGKRPR